ncbi:MAG: hypothetical protein HWQ35_04685 [Nostoc sp. NMS1]|uniref:hypothetical protein n=1 Tax=unclassified Nostoc TaxID=2593658 RepID=UPI0025F20DFE|nr:MULTISPECIES: hypothetical protein [unclassified Nostoc]MBN3905891.1 hypothetical protein [Nostoc sp. NMS1]MBN3989295.1 hypothetical protein [Nostoc sp. NMS2]
MSSDKPLRVYTLSSSGGKVSTKRDACGGKLRGFGVRSLLLLTGQIAPSTNVLFSM